MTYHPRKLHGAETDDVIINGELATCYTLTGPAPSVRIIWFKAKKFNMVMLLQQTAFMCSVCMCMCQLNGFMAYMECVYCAVRTEGLYIGLILVCKRKKRGLLHYSSRPLNDSNTTVSLVWLRVGADVLRLGAASSAAQRHQCKSILLHCTETQG
jgi:hypothetical protein